MMTIRYHVTLTNDERSLLEAYTSKGKISVSKYKNALALLLCDISSCNESKSVSEIAITVGESSRSIERLKKRFVEEGLESALERKVASRPPRELRFDGAFEARLLALACSETPEGFCRWTVRLLADKAVELNYTDSISKSSVHSLLKKMKFSLT
jgi:transposase